MKTILVLTDFTKQAENAANYAYQFAKLIKANIILFHAFGVPEKNTIVSQVVYPSNYDELKENSLINLKASASAIRKEHEHLVGFKPLIIVDNEFGTMTDLASEMVIHKAIGLVVIGGAKSHKQNRMFFGSDTYDLLDKVMCPVLFIPDEFQYNKVERIFYATDLKSMDAAVVNSLAALSSLFNADVMLTHISKDPEKNTGKLAQLKDLVKADTQIHYQHIKSKNVVQTLCELNINVSAQKEMLALVHKKYHFPESIFHNSISKQINAVSTKKKNIEKDKPFVGEKAGFE